MEKDFLKTRFVIIQLTLGIVFLIFIGRLFYLQILRGSVYKLKSETQAIKAQVVHPFRGNIYDKNGQLLVYNSPSFSLQLFTGSFRKDRLNFLAHILGMDTVNLYHLILQNIYNYRFGDIKLLRDLEFDIVQKINENLDYLPGVEIVVESKRVYNLTAKMSHIIGYLQEINQEERKNEPYYDIGDFIGKTGLEKFYETELRGQKGKRFVGVSGDGVRTAKFNEGRADQLVRNGDDLILTIDLNLQKKAEQLLEGKLGAIVAIDPNNGDILALVSKPDYDVTLLSGKDFPKNYSILESNNSKPLLNRAIQSRYPPGSTWKPLVALAGLERKVINEHTTFYCSGSFQFGDRTFACNGTHGYVNVRRALQVSCNVFFYQTALKLQFEGIAKWGSEFGFGQRTGIDLPFEITGILPDLAFLKRKYGDLKKVPSGSVVNYGIGQGEISVTPIQMACFTSAIANGGNFFRPRLVKAIRNNILNQIYPLPIESRKIQIDQKNLEFVINGMFDVVNTPGGTAFGISIPELTICGKTGTAQVREGKPPHSWFICFAPKENPKIAISVIVENAGYGAAVAAPIARELLKEFFGIKEPISPIDSTKISPD